MYAVILIQYCTHMMHVRDSRISPARSTYSVVSVSIYRYGDTPPTLGAISCSIWATFRNTVLIGRQDFTSAILIYNMYYSSNICEFQRLKDKEVLLDVCEIALVLPLLL